MRVLPEHNPLAGSKKDCPEWFKWIPDWLGCSSASALVAASVPPHCFAHAPFRRVFLLVKVLKRRSDFAPLRPEAIPKRTYSLSRIRLP